MNRILTGIVTGVLLLTLGRPGAAPAYSAGPEPRPAAAFAAPSGYIVHGVHLPPPIYPSGIASFQTAVGKDIGILMYFRPWDRMTITYERGYWIGPCDDGFLPGQALPGTPLNPPGPSGGGRAIMVTWEPLHMIPGTPNPSDYDNILNGSYNSLIDACADQLKNWYNVTFLVRFMHEMNIPDSPWWAGHSYNVKGDGTGDTEKYKQAWRYVWQRFANKQVTNVQWVWSPNYASNPDVPWNNLHNYYPGDAYVDWIGVDGYHWSTANFQNYTSLFDSVIRDIQCRYAKPIMQAEIGTIPYSGGYVPPNKPSWVEDAYDRMETYPLVRAAVWFNDFAFGNPSLADFRIWASSGSPGLNDANITTAYKNAVADSSFRSTFTGSAVLNPPMTRCASDAVSSTGVLGARPVAVTVGRTGLSSASFDIGALGLGSTTTMNISGCPANTICRWGSTSGPTGQSFSAPWAKHVLVVQAGPSSPLGSHPITISGGGHSVTVQVNIATVVHPIYLPTMRR